jgi:hypothetical protein
MTLACLGDASGAISAPVHWRRALGAPDTRSTEAVATEPSTERLAVGDARGVFLGSDSGSLRRVMRRGPVRDLAFLPDGTLLAATDVGLFLLDPEGRVVDRTPGAGSATRQVARIAVHGDLVAVATGRGAFVSTDLERWVQLDAGLPIGPTRDVALQETAAGLDAWVAFEREVWRAHIVRESEQPPRVEAVSRERPFGGQVGRSPLDLLVLEAGAYDVLVLDPGYIAGRDNSTGAWRVVRLQLPPGASAQRLSHLDARFWVSTDRGLVSSPDLEGPWQRASGPAASPSAFALAAAGSRLFAASDSGLLVGLIASSAGAGEPEAEPKGTPILRASPPIELVQRVALEYTTLQPSEIVRLRRGVSRRGWFPIVDVRLEKDRHRARFKEYDEVYTSSALRRLRDRDRDKDTDYHVGLFLSWDLGDISYHPEEIDVSKEAREVIELRDDVLDEVNQLYFERERLLLELAQTSDPNEARRLRVRTAELAAGLDAWTGGWFGRALGDHGYASHPSSKGVQP